jgi:hypothetical protein
MLCHQEDDLEFHHRNDRSLKSLVTLASHGYYPLFEGQWLLDAKTNVKEKSLTGNEKAKAKTLFKRICSHRTIERQKTVISAMTAKDRDIFVRAFLKMVENKILDGAPELQ